jgi:hypothetical protein
MATNVTVETHLVNMAQRPPSVTYHVKVTRHRRVDTVEKTRSMPQQEVGQHGMLDSPITMEGINTVVI